MKYLLSMLLLLLSTTLAHGGSLTAGDVIPIGRRKYHHLKRLPDKWHQYHWCPNPACECTTPAIAWQKRWKLLFGTLNVPKQITNSSFGEKDFIQTPNSRVSVNKPRHSSTAWASKPKPISKVHPRFAIEKIFRGINYRRIRGWGIKLGARLTLAVQEE